MAVDENDLRHLARCLELAEEAVEAGDEPFGSLLVDPNGTVLFEDRNRISGGDGTRHPELALAQWAAARVPEVDRSALTAYTSGEHCAMCAAAHGWAGLGRIVYAASTEQITGWLRELDVPPWPVLPFSIRDVLPDAEIDGPVPELAEQVRELLVRAHG